MTSVTEGVPLTACWPLCREGPLPKTILGPEYLEKVFFRVGPIEWRCAATDVRKALKALVKRVAPKNRRALPIQGEMAERDRVLVANVCDDPRIRESIRDLVIVTEEGFSNFGRFRKRDRIFKVGRNLPDLLWLGYVNDPACEPFVEWTKQVAVDRLDLGGGYYLTSDVVATALSEGNPPVFSVDSLDFARVLILFAGLLPPGEDLQLLTTGSRLGCIPLYHLLEIAPATQSRPDQDPFAIPADDDVKTSEIPALAAAKGPRLERVRAAALEHTGIVRVSADIERMASNLLELEEKQREAERLAIGAFNVGIGAVLSASETEYQEALALLENARKGKLAVANTRRECVQQAEELTTPPRIPTHLQS